MRIVLALLIGIVTLAAAPPAAATQCFPATLGQQIARADTVLIARVIGADSSTIKRSGNTLSLPEEGVPYYLQVERVFSGNAAIMTVVHHRNIIGAPNLNPGERWLLFLYRDEAGRLQVGPCNPSRIVGDATPLPQELADALGQGFAPGGAIVTSPRTWLYAAGAGAVLMLAVVAAAVLWHRKRRAP